MAVTINGYIARINENTDWVCDTDWEELCRFVEKSDTVIMGRVTFENSEVGGDFPYGKALNVVMTSKKLDHKAENVWFTDQEPKEVVGELEKKGKKRVLIIGGGKTNSWYLEAGVIDEIILSVHPLMLGRGIKVFDDVNVDVKLKLIDVKKMNEDLVQLKYQVVK